MSLKFQPPKFTDNSIEGFDRFILQFERYLGIAEPGEAKKLNIFLLSVGEKGAGYYDDVKWAPLTNKQKNAGTTDYSRAVAFLRSKFLGDKNVLCERIQLYRAR